jgi:hypothetical protein
LIKKLFPPSVVAPVLTRRADDRGAGREGREGRAGAGADTFERDIFERDIDLRASLAHFRESVAAPGSAGAGARRADGRARPRLTALCKFPDRAFAPAAAGLRAWERFRNVGGSPPPPPYCCPYPCPYCTLTPSLPTSAELSFQEAFPAPLSVERHARRAAELDIIYKTDVCSAPRATPRALRGAARRGARQRRLTRGALLQVLDRRLRAVAPPPPPGPKWTRLVLPPVLTGHVS